MMKGHMLMDVKVIYVNERPVVLEWKEPFIQLRAMDLR